jgi:hypothetical protein
MPPPQDAAIGTAIPQYKPQAGVSLETLPAEVRNQIYGLLLTKSEPIEIAKYRDRIVTGPYFRDYKTHRFRTWDSDKGKWIDNPPSFASILFTSKTMYTEAAPVLYGTNCFVLSRQCAASDFIEKTGEKLAQKYLTMVDLCEPSLVSLKKSLKDLRVAVNLRTIFLHKDFILKPAKGGGGSHYEWARKWYSNDVLKRAEAFYRAVRSFLVTMKASYTYAGEPWKVIDIIKIRGIDLAEIDPDEFLEERLDHSWGTPSVRARRIEKPHEELNTFQELQRSERATLASFMTRFHQLLVADIGDKSTDSDVNEEDDDPGWRQRMGPIEREELAQHLSSAPEFMLHDRAARPRPANRRKEMRPVAYTHGRAQQSAMAKATKEVVTKVKTEDEAEAEDLDML